MLIGLRAPCIQRTLQLCLPLSVLSLGKSRALAFSATPLATQIRQAYSECETDGVLSLAKSLPVLDIKCTDLVEASVEASNGSTGVAASMINAWLASMSTMEDSAGASMYTNQLLDAFNTHSSLSNIYPDGLTYCLAYSALCRGNNLAAADAALRSAQQVVKKSGGAKRRKLLAANKRRVSADAASIEFELQGLLGPDFGILAETDDYLAVCKPSGVVCYHQYTTAAGKRGKLQGGDMSLVDALLKVNIPLSTLNKDALGIVHRLDRGTSGCLVVAKTDDFHARFVTQLFLRQSRKVYTTCISPVPPDSVPREGKLDSPVGGRPARSYYEIVDTPARSVAQVRVRIETGRRHQVRIHCKDHLSPIVGDTPYGGVPLPKQSSEVDRFFLHASSLHVPALGVNVTAPIPSWWETALSN
jgi:23S rRNA-/tRNA-specific pseudouridylate synthase